MARIPRVINNGRLADTKIDGEWYQDGIHCTKAQASLGQQVYVRDDYKDNINGRKAVNKAEVGQLDRLGVKIKVHYHLPIEAFNARVYALCETVDGGIVCCASSNPNTVILRFPTYNNLSALSKILHSFDKVNAIGDTVYVSFQKEHMDKKTFEVPYEDAEKLIKTLQNERLRYVKGQM
jgi:hypothetical protein